MGIKVDTKALGAKLKELILTQAKQEVLIPGEAKLKAVVDQAADWLDEQAKWGFLGPLAFAAEAADGPMFRQLLWIPAQLAYDQLKTLGEV
jgi:hypothetical protein